MERDPAWTWLGEEMYKQRKRQLAGKKKLHAELYGWRGVRQENREQKACLDQIASFKAKNKMVSRPYRGPERTVGTDQVPCRLPLEPLNLTV